MIKKCWGHPLAQNINVDDANVVAIHREIINSKPLLRAVYLRWYREFLRAYEETEALDGEMLEIGCGASFLEEIIPRLVKTDVVATPCAQKVMNAMSLDLPDKSLRTIFMTHVLHHILYPAKFLSEAQRCLKPGGRLVMIEPSNNFLQRFLARWTDHFEYFDDTVEEWANRSSERMTDANMALPWVIFVRDQKRFQKEFPGLKIIGIRYHTYLSYFISGGVGYRSFLPAFLSPLVDLTEHLSKPFSNRLGTTMTIDIVKV